ncbi:MAG: PAS domain S-box protein [Thermoguttaceae bacterium]|jgi:PAS domain S-box-containing protein
MSMGAKTGAAFRRKWAGIAIRYAFAVVVIAVAVLLRWRLVDAFGPLPTFVTFYPAVLLVASLAGGGPGILATVLAALAADYWFLAPYGSLRIDAPNDVLALGIFTGTNLFLCVLAERLRRARWAEAVSFAQEQQLEELTRLNEELSQQSEELSQQSEELAQQNEELQTQSEEIQTLNAELQHREDMLQKLLDAARLGAAERAVVQDVCAAAKEMFGPAASAVMVFEPQGSRLMVRGQAGLGPEGATVESLPAACTFVELVVAENKTAALADASLRPDLSLVHPPGEQPFQAVLAAPMRTEGRPFGSVAIYSRQKQQWTAEQFRLAEWLAAQCAHILETLRLQAELRESEEKYRDLVQNANSIIIRWNMDGNFTFFNEFAEKFFGFSQSEVIGKNVMGTIVPPTDTSGRDLAAMIEDIKRHPDRYGTNVNENVRKSGERVWISWSNRAIHDERGNMIGVLAVGNDVTAKKQSEEELARLAAIVESSEDAILSKDLNGVIQTWNAGADRLFGYRAEEVVGQPITLLLPPERIQEEEQILERVLSGQHVEHLETVRLAKDGRRIDVSVTVSPVKCQDGKIIGASKIIRDITEGKRAEEALAREQANLRAVFDVVNVGMLVIGEDGAVKQVNDTLSRWVRKDVLAWEGGQPGDFVGCVHALAEPAGCGHGPQCASCPIRNTFASVLRTGQPIHDVEAQAILSVDGNEVLLWLEVSADPLILDGRRHVILAMNNITERKRAEQALRQTAEDLARSNKDLEQFAYVASHDLKEPLRMVTGFMSLLQERCQGKLDAKADEYVSFASDAAARMHRLIDDLLAYSRAGRGAMTERTDIGAVLDRVLSSLTTSIEECGAAITHDPLPMIASNPVELTQVFQNLIANAVKFREERTPEIHVGARRQPGQWLFTVRDNGIGIDRQFADRIFMIFQRLHTREQYPGTGIGLAVCKKIVERHGGRIWMESEPGKGSTFCFTIPDQGKEQG